MTTPPRDSEPASSAEPFEAVVRGASSAEHAGRVTNAQDRVITIEFAREDGPLVEIAEELTVSFRSRAMFEPFVARSRVIFRHENPYRSRYRFRFGERDAEALNALFKRRAALRVRSDGNVTVEARATEFDGATSTACTLRDVSTSGLSLRVGTSDAAELARAERLHLRFRLPGDPELFDVAARVRYRELADDGVRYGLEIERSEVARARHVIERIDAYVERRKAAILSSALGASYLPKRD